MAHHTILGANGAVGRELSRSLAAAGHTLRQVSRHPRKENPSDEVIVGDLLDASSAAAAIAGSDVAYLVAGIGYSTEAWKAQWPRIMANVIDACARCNTSLVFFDNVYAYGAVEGPMTEDTPFNPNSRKGEIRATIATTLLEAMRAREVNAMIVRSADFYYPQFAGATTSMLNSIVFDRLRAAKAPQWLGNPAVPHSFSYTPDLGRSLAMLGTNPESFGQTWHALTTAEQHTGRELVRLACEVSGRPEKLQNAPRWMIRALGVFQPMMREQVEMMYQFERPYVFSSDKLERAFDMQAVTYREAFREVWAGGQAERASAHHGRTPAGEVIHS
jgi:nucleoside-diphosphate-sugar epimerase